MRRWREDFGPDDEAEVLTGARSAVRPVSRGVATVHNGVVLTGEWGDDDSMLYEAAVGPAAAEVVGNRGPGNAQPWGGASYADLDVVGS